MRNMTRSSSSLRPSGASQAAPSLSGCMKSAIVAGDGKGRETMKLITAYELSTKTLSQLCVLYKMLSEELAQTEPCDPNRSNMLASLENISRAISAHRNKGPRF